MQRQLTSFIRYSVALESFITYNGLALSSGGAHQLNRGSAKKIYQDLFSFLKSYTNCKQPDHIQVVMHKFSLGTFFKYCFYFGFPRFDWWNYWSIKKDMVYWNVWPSRLEGIFSMVMADNNLLLCVKWEFLFTDAKADAVIPNQSLLPVLDRRKPKSSLYLRISEERKTLSAWFMLPFDELDEHRMQYLRELQSALPFNFSPKGWRCYTKSAKGNWMPKKLSIQFHEFTGKDSIDVIDRSASRKKRPALVEG